LLPRSGDGKTFPAFGAAARQDLTALLRRHPDEEPVGPLPVPPVRLKCAYALRHDYWNLCSGSTRSGETL